MMQEKETEYYLKNLKFNNTDLSHLQSKNPIWQVFTGKKAGSEDQTVLDLLKDGYEQFELNVANRIVAQNPEKVLSNHCPKCDKLARTPRARQCRFCGHRWQEAPDA